MSPTVTELLNQLVSDTTVHFTLLQAPISTSPTGSSGRNTSFITVELTPAIARYPAVPPSASPFKKSLRDTVMLHTSFRLCCRQRIHQGLHNLDCQ